MKKPVVLVDFDGVLHRHDSPFEGVTRIPDPPVAGALEWLRHMYEFNCGIASNDRPSNITQPFRLAVLSGRSRFWRGRRAMRKWLYQQMLGYGWDLIGGPYLDTLADEIIGWVEFPKTKPDYVVLNIDDRAYRFNGDDFWEGKLEAEQILSFEPWCKKLAEDSPSSINPGKAMCPR